MIDQPNANVQLTFEQLQQIDTTQKRLTNIQNEVFAAEKLLSEIRNDIERITKEKDYQQGILDGLNSDIAGLIETKNTLITTNQAAGKVLLETQQKTEDLLTSTDAKTLALNDRENILDLHEDELHQREEIVLEREVLMKKETKILLDKKAKLQEIITLL